MAAICASATPMGRPSRSRSATRSAYRAAARSSKGSTRPWKSSVKALQKRVGVTQDGVWGPDTTKGLQRALNANAF